MFKRFLKTLNEWLVPHGRGDKPDLQRFELVAEHAPVHIVFTDVDGYIKYANPAASEITGYSREEMIGKRPSLWGRQMETSFYKMLWKTIKEERKVYRGEIQNRRKGGDIYYADVRIAPVVGRDGALLGFVGIEIDVTKRRVAEERVRTYVRGLEVANDRIAEEKGRAETYLASIGDGVAAIDREWTITLWNRAAEELTGWTAKESLGRPLLERLRVVREHDREPDVAFIEDAMVRREKRRMRSDMLLVRKDGAEIPVGDSAAPIVLPSGKVKGAIIVFRDMSAERESRILRSDFAYASHRLRSPITAALWNVEAALDRTKEPAAVEALKLAEIGLLNIRKLANQIVEVSEIDQRMVIPKLKEVDLAKLAADLKKYAKAAARAKGVDVAFAFPASARGLKADAKLLRRALEEIVDNGIAYSRRDGKVAVRAERALTETLFHVQDDGIGIPEEQQGSVFTKFFRASNVPQESVGAGLGLFIAGRYAELHGGRIWFKSKEGRGTTVTLAIPNGNGRAAKAPEGRKPR